MRLPRLTALLACLALPVADAATADPRTDIVIFRYDGVTGSGDATQAFEAFNGMIKQKIWNIQDHVSRALEAENRQADAFDYISDLRVSPSADGSGLSRSEVRDWLDTKDTALQAYLGTIVRSSDGGYVILTRCYFLEGSGLRAFNFAITVNAEEFRNIRDTHSLMILYGIAQEARRLGVPREDTAILIENAIDLIADLDARGAGSDPDLQRIRQAWLEFADAS